MADYYSILNKTISKLPDDSAANRELVYGKARQAIGRQLRAIEPTPSEAAIAKQMESLEEAISRIEADHSFEISMDDVADAVEATIQEPETPEAPVVDAMSEARAANAESARISDTVAVSQADVGAPAVSVDVQPDSPESAIGGNGLRAGMEQPAPTPPVSEPNFQADLSKKRGIMGRLLPYVIGIFVVGGGAYGLWVNKDELMQTLQGVTQSETGEVSEDVPATNTGEAVTLESDETPVETETTEITPAESEPTETDPSEKESTRLGGNGENVVPDPVVVDPVSQPSNVADGNPVELEPAGDPPIAEETAEAPVEVKEVGGETSPATAETPVEQAATGIAQKAFLYEEGGANGGASRSDAAIVWSLTHESPTAGAPVEAVVKGRLDIPDKPLSMVITLKRNTDEGLPASHIIELNFEGGEIDNVARFVMKSTEQARGEGLVAVPAKIDNGYFLIALNNLPQAVETNSKLLLESGWVDIPLGYVTGRRALVTLEKGVTGDKVFREAFADWEKR